MEEINSWGEHKGILEGPEQRDEQRDSVLPLHPPAPRVHLSRSCVSSGRRIQPPQHRGQLQGRGQTGPALPTLLPAPNVPGMEWTKPSKSYLQPPDATILLAPHLGWEDAQPPSLLQPTFANPIKSTYFISYLFFFPQILTCHATPPAMHPLDAPHHFVPSSNCPNHFSCKTGVREGSVLLSNCFQNWSPPSVRD